MTTQLYVIDCTSRQYPFSISDTGATLTVGEQVITFHDHNIPVHMFTHAILHKLPFTVSNHEQTVVYNSANLIGVQVIKHTG